MGVDFTSYSRVKTEPVPERFRARAYPISKKDIIKFEKELQDVPLEMRSLVMVLQGASYNAEGNIIMTSNYKISDELRDEFYEIYTNDEEFITVDWITNIIYKTTEESKSGTTGRSYSGYYDFCKLVQNLNKGMYMPPSVDSPPENGIVLTASSIDCLNGLEEVKKYFVSDTFKADSEKYGNSIDHRFDSKIVPSEDDIHQESWFFREFYSMMTLAADGGIVKIF
jgi:hypothetical protein